MRLETDYWHAMDKQAAQDIQVSPEYIGVSGHPAKRAIEQLKTKIFEGAKNVEIGFTSTGKGSLAQGGTTPEMYGIEDREDIRELAKINEVETSVHAAINLQGFAGLAEGGFREEARENALNEVKRTLDFAADTAGGGPVVVHAGEFPRPLYSIEKTEEGKEKFKAYPEEAKKATVYLVDDRTGQVQQSFRRDSEITIPKVDEETGKISTETKTYSEFEKDYHDLPKKEQEKYGTPEKYVNEKIYDAKKKSILAEANRFSNEIGRARENINKTKEMAKNIFARPDKDVVPEVLNMFIAQNRHLTEEEVKNIQENPKEFLKKDIDNQKENISYYEQGIAGYKAQADDYDKIVKHTESIEGYGIKKSAETLAQAGIYAYEREKAENLTKPLFVAPENVFPEQFGSHPRELRKLITESREEMAKQLHTQRGISMHEAKEIAEDHIKATFDVGHAYTWKKYFQPLPGESLKKTEERFNDWLKSEVKKLAKDKIIGHVHLSDNFGYHDEHLAPGQGHVPIKDFVKALQKEGFDKKMIVEAGAQPEQLVYQTMTGAWRALNSPIYRIDGTSQSWTDIGQSYFAKTGSPNYVVGDYAPSKDWTLWSETQLE